MNHVLAPRVFHAFSGGEEGGWRVDRIRRITGDALPSVRRLDERRDIMEAQSRHISTGLAFLRASREWTYVSREVDVRVVVD